MKFKVNGVEKEIYIAKDDHDAILSQFDLYFMVKTFRANLPSAPSFSKCMLRAFESQDNHKMTDYICDVGIQTAKSISCDAALEFFRYVTHCSFKNETDVLQ